MPLVNRLKKTFSRSDSSSETSSLSRTTTNESDRRKNSNVYQPGEKMPPPKYRRPVAKEHKELLESFDFAKAWRRQSHHSIYSPHASPNPSRAPSVVSVSVGRGGSIVTASGAVARKSRVESTDSPRLSGLTDRGSDTSAGELSDSSSLSAPTTPVDSDILTDALEGWSFSH